MYMNNDTAFKQAAFYHTKAEAEAHLFDSLKTIYTATAIKNIPHFVISRGPAQFVPVVVMSKNGPLPDVFFTDKGIHVLTV